MTILNFVQTIVCLGIDLDTPDENGLNALMWASAYGQTRTVNMLVSSGADVNYIGTTGETALLLAAAGGHLDVIKSLLLHDADVNHEDFVRDLIPYILI